MLNVCVSESSRSEAKCNNNKDQSLSETLSRSGGAASAASDACQAAFSCCQLLLTWTELGCTSSPTLRLQLRDFISLLSPGEKNMKYTCPLFLFFFFSFTLEKHWCCFLDSFLFLVFVPAGRRTWRPAHLHAGCRVQPLESSIESLLAQPSAWTLVSTSHNVACPAKCPFIEIFMQPSSPLFPPRLVVLCCCASARVSPPSVSDSMRRVQESKIHPWAKI